MTTTAPLNVEIVLPEAPHTLATPGFLATLAEVEKQIASMAVADPASAQAAADLQSRLTRAGSDLEKQRKALKEPFIAAGRAIDEAASGPASRIEIAKGSIKRLLTAYDAEQRRIAAEAERKRQEELQRLREQQLREEAELRQKAAEAARIAAELAKANEEPPMEFDDSPPPPDPAIETARRIAELQKAPAVVAPKPVGVVFRTTLLATVTDVSKLPDMFVTKTANVRAIAATFCSGYKEGQPLPVCAGVEFRVDKQPVSTGR